MNKTMIRSVSTIGIFFICWILPLFTYSQERVSDTGKIEIIQDPRLETLLTKHIQINQNKEGIEGFRIQIFSDSGNNSKNQAQAVNDGFIARFPTIKTYLTFKSPNYRVRIGDFRNRLDAQRFLLEIASDYTNAFIVSEKINLPQVESFKTNGHE
jgi:hypothetical protein